MPRVNFAFKTNNEDYFETFEANDTDAGPNTPQPRLGLILLAGLGLAATLGVALAALH